MQFTIKVVWLYTFVHLIVNNDNLSKSDRKKQNNYQKL